jgi:Predicted amidohydrolase
VNFALNVCYDIRFPVWSRNRENEYDVLIYISNFPDSRIEAAHTLAKARAIENMSYVLFVNRIGNDPVSKYSGSSLAIDYKGNSIGNYISSNKLNEIMPGIQVVKVEIDTTALNNFREKFPAWRDADTFTLK